MSTKLFVLMKTLAALLLVAGLLCLAAPAFAQGGEEGPGPESIVPAGELPALPDSLSQLILVLLAPGTAGAAASWLAEKAPWFQKLPKGWKVVTFPVLAFLLAGIGAVLRMAVSGVPETEAALLNILFMAGMAAVLFLLGSQVWHEKLNLARKEIQALPELLARLGKADLATLASLLAAVLDQLAPEASGAPAGGEVKTGGILPEWLEKTEAPGDPSTGK